MQSTDAPAAVETREYRVTSYGRYGTASMTLPERPADPEELLGARYTIEHV